jgi:hypothetical protein
MTNQKEIEQAKQLLKDAGYYVGNLWHISDVNTDFICTPQQAQEVLEQAINSDYIKGEINDTISMVAEDIFNLKERK